MADSEAEDYSDMVIIQNRRKRKAGGFQNFGFDGAIYRGIQKCGYRAPTPIQRKAIPTLLSGRDVVAMARTGSGKTAAFLLPMLQKLKRRQPINGARALIFSPTRELAQQTYTFCKQLGSKTGLYAALVVGGDSMDDQFAVMHENPDVIITTPGRMVHLAIEMELKFSNIQYVVFDEADRLFEMGFIGQLSEILNRLPCNRQTCLFSATLPRQLVDFARAGLSRPVLIRLDVDAKIPDTLHMEYAVCREEEKLAALLEILERRYIKGSNLNVDGKSDSAINDKKRKCIVFCATKHHVEFLKDLLKEINIDAAFLYSSLDLMARRLQLTRFKNGDTNLFLTTDLAARGVDLPILDDVINWHFPSKPKLFVHRVGRTARAGRAGQALSLLSTSEIPYLIDLYLFLGRPLQFLTTENLLTFSSEAVGLLPSDFTHEFSERLENILSFNVELNDEFKVAQRAWKQYIRSCSAPSTESIRRAKQLTTLAIHPLFGKPSCESCSSGALTVADVRNFKPQLTIFELNRSNRHENCAIMKTIRRKHSKFSKLPASSEKQLSTMQNEERLLKNTSNDDLDIESAFAEIVRPNYQPFKIDQGRKKSESKRNVYKHRLDYENFIPYRPNDWHSEKGFAVEKGDNFVQDADAAVLDLTADDPVEIRRQKQQNHRIKWDRKRKKFVGNVEFEQNSKKVKSESGGYVNASYKSGRYEQWKKHQRLDNTNSKLSSSCNEEKYNSVSRGTSLKVASASFAGRAKLRRRTPDGDVRKTSKGNKRGSAARSELRSSEQILKERRRKERLHSFQRQRQQQRASKSRRRAN